HSERAFGTPAEQLHSPRFAWRRKRGGQRVVPPLLRDRGGARGVEGTVPRVQASAARAGCARSRSLFTEDFRGSAAEVACERVRRAVEYVAAISPGSRTSRDRSEVRHTSSRGDGGLA